MEVLNLVARFILVALLVFSSYGIYGIYKEWRAEKKNEEQNHKK
jgi:hypothetical protein